MIKSIEDIAFGTRYHPVISLLNGVCVNAAYEYDIKRNGIINIPEAEGVYIIGFPNDYYYIGETNNFRTRINIHIANLLFKDLSKVKWYKEVDIKSVNDFKLYILVTEEREKLERSLIENVEDKLYNKI